MSDEPFPLGVTIGPPVPDPPAHAPPGRGKRRLTPEEVDAFGKVFDNVSAGSLELYANMTPQARQYFLSLVEPDLRAAQKMASIEALYSVDYARLPVDPLTFVTHTDYMGHAGKDMFPAWRPHFKRINSPNSGIHEVIVTGAMGIGKAQPLTARVLTPTGWRAMGDVQVGDVLVNPEGGTTRVVGVHPQGVKPVYRVTFSDGAETECCDDHLWEVQTPSQRYRSGASQVLALKDMRERLHDPSGNRRFFVPMVAPVEMAPSAPLPMDPYALGVLLGDGGLTNATPRVTSADPEILDGLAAGLPTGVGLRRASKYDYRITTRPLRRVNPLTEHLRDLGLQGLGSHEKFIPATYLTAAMPDRLAILQGLFDTDGSAAGSCVEYTSTSRRLVDGVRELVHSLGGTARVQSRTTHYTYRGQRKRGKVSYRLFAILPAGIAPFRLHRKLDAYTPGEKYGPSRSIEAVTAVGSVPCQCIQVDSPRGLYVTDDHIVTHNTALAMMTVAYKIYLVSLLLDPAAYYGLQARSKVAFGLYALTRDQIEDVGFYVLRDQLIDQSPYFCDVFPRSDKGTTSIHWPQKAMHVITGSSALHAIGQNLFAIVADELNYFARGELTAKRARELVAEVSRRLESRFVTSGGHIPGVAMFLSQTRTARDFLEQRIRESKSKEGVLVIRGPRWDFNPKGYDLTDAMRGFKPGDPAFRVFTGDEVQDARVLDEVVKRPDGSIQIRPMQAKGAEPKGGRILHVPILHWRAHQDDLHGALRSIDDVPTASFTPFFPRREVIDRAFNVELPFPFTAQTFPCHEASATRLQDLYDYELMTSIHMGRRRPLRHATMPRYLHLDLAQTGDRAGIAMVHPSEYFIDETKVIDAEDPAGVGEAQSQKRVEVDFYIGIEAGPLKEPIDYGKIRVFVDWLRRCGFWIKKITADRHQSFDMLQRFREMGFETDELSVDRTSIPYKTFRQALNEGRVELPFPTTLNPGPVLPPPDLDMTDEEAVDLWKLHLREGRMARVLVFQELTGLEHDVERDKVDHRELNPDGSPGSKDVADGLCGAVYSCLTDKSAPGEPPGSLTQAAKVTSDLNRYLRFARPLGGPRA